MQRKRWARGQGEVLHVHFDEVRRWRNRRMWLLGFEAFASLLWVGALTLALVIATLGILIGVGEDEFGFALGWGVAIALVATIQTTVALTLEHAYDRSIFRPLLFGVLYPLAYWIISGLAALHSEVGSPWCADRPNAASSGTSRGNRSPSNARRLTSSGARR